MSKIGGKRIWQSALKLFVESKVGERFRKTVNGFIKTAFE